MGITAKRPFECSVLVVDDEEAICQMLNSALSPRYNVTVCKNGKEALAQIEKHDFDLVVTDLMLPDISGIEVLTYAKSRDEFTEVLMITGYASLDTATAALNLGAGSYLAKPFSITDFLIRTEKMIASRLFHLKSLQLMKHSDFMDPAVKGHLSDITSLYYFTRKLMLSLEISEVMRIILEEANQKIGADFCCIGINLLDYYEVYAMPSFGELDIGRLKEVLPQHWDDAFSMLDKDKFVEGDIPLFVYKGRQGEFKPVQQYQSVSYPLIVTGKTIGNLSVFLDIKKEIPPDVNQFLHVLTSIISPVIEHAYMDLQARMQAKTDSLTGIANHRHFHEALEREIARANRKKSCFSLILADIDNFKSINDTYGHQVGDAVIIDLTKRFTANIRTGDVAARYGGEEFCIILPDTDEAGAECLAKRICKAVANTPFADSKYQFIYTASFGLAVYNGAEPLGKDELIFKADEALYESKRAGKNRVTVSTSKEK
ncbi:MAG: diguanylate cyclase [Chitinispirillaceae bacterium]